MARIARGRLQQVVLSAELAGFRIIDNDCVQPSQGVFEFRPFPFDPEIHGVARDEGGSLHLSLHQ